MALAPSKIHELFLGSHGQSRAGADVPMERAYMLEALSRYWPRHPELILALTPTPPEFGAAKLNLPPKLTFIELPPWAHDCGVDGQLLAPADFLHAGIAWNKVPWLEVAFWHLTAIPEQAHEMHHGKIESQSKRLKGWNPKLWAAAWVNRVALFLRRWAARNAGADEAVLFGPLPEHELILLHELKSAANAGSFVDKLKRLFSRGAARPPWSLEQALQVEGGGPFKSILCVKASTAAPIRDHLRTAASNGWRIAMDISGDENLESLRNSLEGISGVDVVLCRSAAHDFTWQQSWSRAGEAGFVEDYSLGFVDAALFRTGAALRYKPWRFRSRQASRLQIVPTIRADAYPSTQIRRIVAEARKVGGTLALALPALAQGSRPEGLRQYADFLATIRDTP